MRALCAALGVSALLAGQQPAPLGDATMRADSHVDEMIATGEKALQAEDPVPAWRTFQGVELLEPGRQVALVGLGRAHLLLGRASTAVAYAEAALRVDGKHQDAMALLVRAKIRAREFETAARSAESFVARTTLPGAELLAAEGSALFRVQRIDDAADVYRAVLLCDPEHPEAHLRLGSGLSAPCTAAVAPEVVAAVTALHAGRVEDAIAGLRSVLAKDDGNPIVHRLLGEALYERRTLACMAMNDEAFARLRAARPMPDVGAVPIADFVPGYTRLSTARRDVVARAAALFASRLPKMLAIGGRHDLLLETERTTDAEPRAMLRGRRTFDGRVWDDVRGIGGLRAATGIEALDDAAQFGFDTLVHEMAHQVHYFALPPVERARIRALYDAAKAGNRCLDFYAATNEAEYFGQGVEAFASLGKRPGGETTHGHTRFELFRVDRELHDFIARIVDSDPLDGPAREPLLVAAIAVALRVGRPEDAAVAASMLPPGGLRERAEQMAAAAVRVARQY